MESVSSKVKNQEEDEFVSDDWIFSSEAFNDGDELFACVGYINRLCVEVNTQKFKYKINCRYIKHPDEKSDRKTILFSHGHSTNSNWVTWIKLAVYLFNCEFDVILFDLPGFGRSKVNDQLKVHFKNWLDDGPNMVKGLVNNLKIPGGKISVCGFCGGGALMIRTMATYPDLFNKYHIFYNLIISAYPKDFDKIIAKYKFVIRVFWNPDVDHPTYSVSYKWLNNQNKLKNHNIKLVNITADDLLSSGLWAMGYGRDNTDFLFIFLPSINFLNFSNSFYNENITEYTK
jgi:pimeloyl-ACP methyl ester carboxylesterase